MPRVTTVLLLVLAGCQLEREHQYRFLDQQYLVSDLENTFSHKRSLEQELARERTHVKRLQSEVAQLQAYEEALATEAEQLETEILAAEDDLDTLYGLADDVDAQRVLITALRDPIDVGDPASLQARVELLSAEVERLSNLIRALAPPPAEPSPAPSSGGG